jgi:predicted MFS family arabinose efflux permease
MKNEKLLLLVLALVQFTNIVDFIIIMPLNPVLSKLFSISPTQFGLLVSSYTFSAGISGFLSAFFADKFDRKQMLFFCYAGFTIGTMACGLAATYQILLVARSFTGLFGGVLFATVLSIVGDAIPLERRGAAMGQVMAAFSAATVLGVPLGLYLATKYSWNVPFLFLALLGFFITGLIYFFIPSFTAHIQSKKDQVNPLQVLGNIAQDSNLLRTLTLTFVLTASQFVIIPFLSDSLVANAGLTQEQLPLIYLTGGFFTIFSSPLIGKLADTFGKVKIFMVFAVLMIIPVFIATNLGKTPLFWVLSVTIFFFIFSGGRMIPATTIQSAAPPLAMRGSFMSINASVQNLASAMAAYVAGLIIFKDENGVIFNYQYVGFLAIGLNFVAMFVIQKIKVVN